MTEEVFEAQIREISSAVDDLPEPQRSELAKLIEETRRRHACIRDSITLAREALDDLRLYQKYLLFDAEAREREAKGRRRQSDGNTPL